MYQILIVEDHPVMRESLNALIGAEHDIHVGGLATTCAEARAHLAQHTVDLVLIDLSLPDGSGLELVVDLSRDAPHLPLIVVSGHQSRYYKTLAMRAGARAYLDKIEIPQRLIPTIRTVLAPPSRAHTSAPK